MGPFAGILDRGTKTAKTMQQVNVDRYASALPIRMATVGLLILMDLPLRIIWLFKGDSRGATIAREVVFWALTAAIVLFALFVERRPLSSVGLSAPTWKSVAFGVVANLVMTGAIAFIYLVIYPLARVPVDIGKGTTTALLPYWLNVVAAAMLDRFLHHCHVLNLKCESYRMKSRNRGTAPAKGKKRPRWVRLNPALLGPPYPGADS